LGSSAYVIILFLILFFQLLFIYFLFLLLVYIFYCHCNGSDDSTVSVTICCLSMKHDNSWTAGLNLMKILHEHELIVQYFVTPCRCTWRRHGDLTLTDALWTPLIFRLDGIGDFYPWPFEVQIGTPVTPALGNV